MRERRIPIWLRGAILYALVSAGCSDDDTSTTQAGGSGGGGMSSTGGSNVGGEGGGVATGGLGGGGGTPGPMGPGSTELVSAGQVSTSPSFKMVFTLGQPTQIQGTSTSPSYRFQGGLIGANGSLP